MELCIRMNLMISFGCLFFAILFAPLNVHGYEAVKRSHNVTEKEAFTYGKKTGTGPDQHWGGLCATGKFQSPIDLRDKGVAFSPAAMGQMKRAYKPAPAVLRNRGHDIQVAWKGDAGGIIINGTEYKLLQAHWHTPAEHTLDGKSFNMELHMVHKNSQGQLAVVGILYHLGRPDPFLAKLLKQILILKQEAIKIGKVNPWGIKFGSKNFFRYAGSLTVPPCTEGVLWTVLKTVRTVSTEQLSALKQAVHGGFQENARPTQRSEGRTIYSYRRGSRV